MCSRSGSLSAQARLKTFAERGTEECLVRRLVGGISIGGPLRPTPPSLPPPSSSPPLCARFYNFLAGHKAARARSPNGEDSSPPSRVIYPRAASRMRRKCEKALLPLLPSPHPLHLPPSSRAETETKPKNRRPKFSHSPPFYRVRGSKSAKGATRARPAISAPSGQRYASGKRTRGGSVRSTDSSA